MSTFLERLIEEETELTVKCNKLSDFIDGDAFKNIPEIEQVDLREQFEHMLDYRNVLLRRIDRNSK